MICVLSAAAHAFFAYRETIDWGPEFVGFAAKRWRNQDKDERTNNAHIAWARPLAFNIGIYNLLLALGLAWTAWQAFHHDPIAGPFAMFLGLFLLGAALAAGITKVYPALAAQGILGVLLVVAAATAR
jgi:uncharacterized membrane protein